MKYNRIRVFLSSTFQDMQEKRDVLVNEVFPYIRVMSEQMGIPFSWCDLRWGISNFKAENVLRHCLNGIDDCDPFFLGLLGNYYGSIPKGLSKKQKVSLFKKFAGLQEMINSHLSFTDIEMRYFLLKNQHDTDFCFFYYAKDNSRMISSGVCKRLLSCIKTGWQSTYKHDTKLHRWRGVILNDRNTISREINDFWTRNGNEKLRDTAIEDLVNTIERKYTKEAYPKQEIILNEQIYYYELLKKKHFSIGYESVYDSIYLWLNNTESISDCLFIHGSANIGKTQIATQVLKKCEEEGSLILFYYVGASRAEDTPLCIFRSILYQLCKSLNLNYIEYENLHTKDEIKDSLNKIVSKVSRKVNVLIDGIGSKVYSSTEALNTFLSWIPQKNNQTRFILTSDCILSENERAHNLEIKINQNNIYLFMNNYLQSEYLIDDKNLENKFHDYQFVFADLDDIKTTIDEIIISNTRSNNTIEEIKLDPYYHVFKRINTRLLQHSFLDKNTREDLKKGVVYLSLSRYGIFEADVYYIFKNYQTWTILYSFIYPYLASKGRLGLKKSISSVFIDNVENIDDYRKDFCGWLIDRNVNDEYTKEIAFQYSEVSNKECLCEFLCQLDVFNYFVKKDPETLCYYLLLLERNSLLAELNKELEDNIRNVLGISGKILLYLNIANVYLEILPRFNYACHFIKVFESNYNEDPEDPVLYSKYIEIKVKTFIAMCRFEDAKQILANSTLPNKIKQLELEAGIYDNVYQSGKESHRAIPIYKKLVELNQNDSVEITLHSLNRICRLQGVSHIDENRQYIDQFKDIFNKMIVPGSHLYYKFKPEKEILDLLLRGYKGTKVGSEDEESFFLNIKKTHERMHNSYSHMIGSCLEECECLLLITELIRKKIKVYEERKDLKNKKKCILDSHFYAEKYHELISTMYGRNSLMYALAEYTMSTSYKDMAQTDPFKKDEYLRKALNFSENAERIWTETNTVDHFLKVKLFHNRAIILLHLRDYENALMYVRKSIIIKRQICSKNELSLFYSYQLELEILKKMFIWNNDDEKRKYFIELLKETINRTRAELDLVEEEDYKKEALEELNSYNEFIDSIFKNKKKRYIVQCKELFKTNVELSERLAEILNEKISKTSNIDINEYNSVIEVSNKELQDKLKEYDIETTFCDTYPCYKDYVSLQEKINMAVKVRTIEKMEVNALVELAERIAVMSNTSFEAHLALRRLYEAYESR